MKRIENRKNRNIPGEDAAFRALSRTLQGTRAPLGAGRKARAALALAVSLWIAEGAFWAPGVASAEQEVTITSTKAQGDTTSAEAQATGAESALLYTLGGGA